MAVPRLGLAPKRRRPLALWNPLDYLLLLYWTFFFPQALRWYETKFGIGKQFKDCDTWAERIQWFRTAHCERSLWLQGILLTIVTPLLLAVLLDEVGISVNAYGVAYGVALGVALGVAGGVAGGVAFGVAGGVAGGVAFGVAYGVAVGVAGGVAYGVAFGVTYGVTYGVTVGVTGGVAFGVTVGVAGGVAFGVAIGVTGGVLESLTGDIVYGVALGVAYGVAYGVAGGVAILRPEAILGRLGLNGPYGKSVLSHHITYIPWQGLTKRLTHWLSHDWNTGIHNTNQLLAYTQQFIPVVKSVEESLSQVLDEQLFSKTAILASEPFDWDVVRYASASLENKLKEKFIGGLFILPGRQRLKKRFDSSLRFDLPHRAVAAGFWLLHDKSPSQATEAFKTVRHITHGEEMYQLACCLTTAQTAKTLEQKSLIANHQLPAAPLLRPNTWQAMAQLRHAADNAQLMLQSYSRSTRSLALNRALGALVNILDHPDDLPNAEKDLILQIAKSWRNDFLELAADVGEVDYSQPVLNPYVAGDPVEGDLFAGRDDIIKQLQELWLIGNQLQSVVLYGHRRMGKTSILRNLSRCLGNNPKVAYVNLLTLGQITEGTGEVLITISDAIAKTVELPAPKDDDLLRLPEITFKRYLQKVIKHLDKTGLIIALDEFEQLEELIQAGSLTPDFIKFLRGLVQLSPCIGFAFAGLHTLEEMTEDYFNPFFASVLPIHVNYLSQAATRQLVANPNLDFTLDYAPGVLDEIYSLTAGQPYLTQLLGFQLVRLYNHQRFEQNTDRPPTFTSDDLHHVIENTDIYSKGRYYFTGVWNQAEQDTPHQQPILKALANEPKGLPVEAIAHTTKLQKPEIVSALQTLTRHDVVAEDQSHWRIMVPLFRRWVSEHRTD